MQPLSHKISITRLAAAVLCGMLMASCQPGQQQAPPPAPTPQVTVVTVQPQQILLTTELPGRTSAYRMAEIRPRVNGLVLKRLFTEGADVQAGDLLYQIDPAPFQAALANAKAALGRSEANLPAIRSRVARYQELLADKAVSQQEYDDAASALSQTEADIAYGKPPWRRPASTWLIPASRRLFQAASVDPM
jgi:membrane fusion protein (multidrug efflux system)